MGLAPSRYHEVGASNRWCPVMEVEHYVLCGVRSSMLVLEQVACCIWVSMYLWCWSC